MVDADAELVKSGANAPQLALANRQFHRQIHRATHNRYLLDMLDRMRRSLALLSGTTLALPGRGADSIAEHASIVDAIEARDEDGADAAARRHIFNAYKVRLRLGSQESL